MVIYNDRDVATCPLEATEDPETEGNEFPDTCVQVHGGGSLSEIRGVIYAPTTNVFARGNGGILTLDQAIGSTFEARGNGGTINVAYDTNFIPLYQYAGLVE